MPKQIIMLVILTLSLSFGGSLLAKPGRMLGEAPINNPSGKQKVNPPKVHEKKKVDEEKTNPLLGVTKRDYSLYLKMGDRSSKWNEYVKPAFESFDNGNIATASIFLNKAYEMGCKDPLVLFRLGIIKEIRGKTADAAVIFTQAAEGIEKYYPKHPISEGIYKHTGRALYGSNRHLEALPYLTEALKLEPNDFMLLFMAGQILHQMKEPDKAKIALEKALGVSRPAGIEVESLIPLLHELITVTFKMKDFQACANYIDQTLAIYPTDSLAINYKKKLTAKLRQKRELEMIKKFVQ